MFDLRGKNVLIIGGAKGIGKRILEEFAKAGANVAFIYNSSIESAADIEKEWENSGTAVKGYRVDITCYSNVKETIKTILEDFKAVDILINNAGITKDSYLMMMSPEAWDKVVNTNLTGVFNVTKQLYAHFVGKKSGKIINITSVGGLVGMAGQTNYSATKAGIIGFTKSLSKELAPKGINVNAIAPGYIHTEMLDTIPDKLKEQYVKSIPAGRLGDAADVAYAAMFLASDYANYIHGQVIVVDGGLIA